MSKKIDFDVTQHIMVPKHTKLSDKERDQFLKDNNLNFIDIPKILVSDAAIQNLDAKPGDIIRIERRSPTAGWSMFYRGVINE